jgi:hypothetical protein
MTKFHAHIRQHGGVPTLFVNDRPLPCLAPYSDSALARLPLQSEIAFVHVGSDYVNENGVSAEKTEELIDAALSQNPKSFVCVRTFPTAPCGWAEAHPEDCVQFDPDLTSSDVVPARLPSYGSAGWQQAVAKTYEEFSHHLYVRYDGRVILHQFGAGSQGEWGPFGAPDDFGRWIAEDFSPAMHAHFRSWIRAKYRDDVCALRRAWGDPNASFETARVPDREERLRTDWFTFRHPLRRQVTDYYHAYTDAIADCIIAFCEAIKRGTNGDTLAGSHAGGFLDNGLHAFLYHGVVHNNFRRVARSAAVDTFTSPISYLNRKPGGSPNSMAPTGSLRLRNKYRIQDHDNRTHIGLDTAIRANEFYNFVGVPRTADESVAVMKRDVGRVILGGYGLWWHEHVRGMYNATALQECVVRLTEIARVALHLERGFLPDMAVVADERSSAAQECANRLLYPLLYAQRVEDFSHAGISWDIFEFSDFFEADFPRSKLLLMLNLFELSPSEIKAIRSRLTGTGAIVVWFFAPAIQGPDGFSLDAVRELTGFRVRSVDAESIHRVSITNYAHPLTQGLGSLINPHSIGTGFLGNDERDGIFGPILYVDDDESTTLGMLDSLYRPGLAVKQMDGWTSVYSAAPRLSRKLLRNLAHESGIHQYVDTEDMITVTPDLLLLHGLGAGSRTLRFDRACDVIDLWSGEVLGCRVTTCPVDLAACDTRILFHGDMARLDAARSAAAR